MNDFASIRRADSSVRWGRVDQADGRRARRRTIKLPRPTEPTSEVKPTGSKSGRCVRATALSPTGAAVGVAVTRGGRVAVGVAVGEGVCVGVAVGEGVSVAVGVAEGVAEGVNVGVGVTVGRAVGRAVGRISALTAGRGVAVGGSGGASGWLSSRTRLIASTKIRLTPVL